jgi:PAS domain S-box-containing protein
MADGLLIADAETLRFLRANGTICRMLGYRREELLARSVADIHPAAGLSSVVEQFHAMAAGNLTTSETLSVLRKDGTAFHAVVSTSLITCAGRRCVAGFFRDVTENERATDLLRQSLEEIRAIYENMGDGLLITDRNTLRLLRANRSICAMLGYTEAELLTRSLADLHPPEVLATLVEPPSERSVTHHPFQANVPMIRRDGSLLYVDISRDQVIYNGRPCALGVFRDVTERRQAQAALERERQTLWHMLQASDHERQLIAYEIHDGLTQLLTGAMMQYQAHEHLRNEQPARAQTAFAMGNEMLQMAHEEARRLISGVRPPVLDEAGVETAIAHLVHDRRLTKGPHIEYQSDVQFERLPPVLENALYRIAQESLANACRHSQSARIRVSLEQEGQRILFQVQDWGVGFDLAAIPAGHFGLEGIRERVRLLGGKLTLDTAPGRGTRVHVELPLLATTSA